MIFYTLFLFLIYCSYMLELQDIQKLTEVLANKGDIQILREDVTELREEIAELKVTVSNLVTITDRLIGRVELLH